MNLLVVGNHSRLSLRESLKSSEYQRYFRGAKGDYRKATIARGRRRSVIMNIVDIGQQDVQLQDPVQRNVPIYQRSDSAFLAASVRIHIDWIWCLTV